MKKAVLYINQFFGGIGGEDQADFEPVIKEGAAGSGTALQAALQNIEITHTVICGDNYMTGHKEEALERIGAFLEDKVFDIFFAGPAFQSGRYGMSCGEMCSYISEKYKVPALTCMNPENPGVDAYRESSIYILKGNKSAVKMRKDAKAVAALAEKIMAGEALFGAEEEGYFPRGIRRPAFVEKNPVDRAVDMLLARLADEPYKTEMPIKLSDSVIPAKGVKEPGRALIALITTGGLVPLGNPDHIPSGTASVWKTYDISGLDALKPGEFYSIHGGYSTNNVNDDPEVLIPLSVVRRMEEQGEIGRLYPKIYTTTGNLTVVKEAKRMGEEIAADLQKNHVDGCIFVST